MNIKRERASEGNHRNGGGGWVKGRVILKRGKRKKINFHQVTLFTT